jgi:hypothetical protein
MLKQRSGHPALRYSENSRPAARRVGAWGGNVVA